MSIRVFIVLVNDQDSVRLSESIPHKIFSHRRRDPSFSINQIHEGVLSLSQRHIHRPETCPIAQLHLGCLSGPSVKGAHQRHLLGFRRQQRESHAACHRLRQFRLFYGLRAGRQTDDHACGHNNSQETAESRWWHPHARESIQPLDSLQEAGSECQIATSSTAFCDPNPSPAPSSANGSAIHCLPSMTNMY
jgi:hypothetical protein